MTRSTVAAIWRWTWPVALALAMTVLNWGGNESDEAMRMLSQALLLLPLLYVVVAKLRRREASWPTLVVLLVAFAGLRALDVIPPAAVFGTISLLVLMWGAVDGQLLRSGEFQVQALGLAGFGALSLIGLIIEPDAGRYLVATGWVLHGVWDVVYILRDKVVARTWALWCAVIDVGIGVQLVIAT